MWYAPIGSLEYIKNLHNDILIKKYILSEQRLKQLNLINFNLLLQDKSSSGLISSVSSASNTLKNIGVSHPQRGSNVRGSAVISESSKKVALKSKGSSETTSGQASSAGVSQANRLNRIKGCAVDVQILRSFKKTYLNVVTYDSSLKKN